MKGLRSRTALLAALMLAGTLLPGLAACGNGQPRVPQRRPVVVDTDMSSDDIMALTYLLERSDISVRAITVQGAGVANGRPGADNARRLLRSLGIHKRIPIAYGPAQPLSGAAAFPGAWRASADRRYGLKLASSAGPVPTDTAVSLLSGTLRRSPRPVTLVTLGPLTDRELSRSGGFQLIIGRLRAGKTLSDVNDVIQCGHVTKAPGWFQVMSVLPAPPAADAVWGIALTEVRVPIWAVSSAGMGTQTNVRTIAEEHGRSWS